MDQIAASSMVAVFVYAAITLGPCIFLDGLTRWVPVSRNRAAVMVLRGAGVFGLFLGIALMRGIGGLEAPLTFIGGIPAFLGGWFCGLVAEKSQMCLGAS